MNHEDVLLIVKELQELTLSVKSIGITAALWFIVWMLSRLLKF